MKIRTIDKVVEEIKSVYPNYVNPMMGDDDKQRLHDRLNEILEIHKTEKRSKGKWILSGGKYRCSECGEKAKHILTKAKAVTMNTSRLEVISVRVAVQI